MLGRHRQRGGYSEIVIDSERWEAMLPDAIEAFFYPVTGECALDTRCQIHTRAVHQAFLYLREVFVNVQDECGRADQRGLE